MPNQPKTPLKRLRVDDELWREFGEAVARHDPPKDRSAVIRDFMRWYIRSGTGLPDRPARPPEPDG